MYRATDTLEHKGKRFMDIKNKQMIEALKKELKHYELYKKADRAEQVKKEIKALGGKIENKAAKPKAEKKVVKK